MEDRNEKRKANYDCVVSVLAGSPMGFCPCGSHSLRRQRVAPGLSSILFKDHKPIAAYGSPGGATIINSVFQITLNLIDHGMTIREAIDAPRISVTSAGGSLTREAGFTTEALEGLKSLGHTIPTRTSSIGSVQAIYIDPQTGEFSGGADNRREGTVIVLPR